MQLSEHLETNLAALNARLGSSADFYAKRIELYHIRGAILLFDGMASLESLWELLLDAASRQTPPLRLGALPSGEQVYELLSRHSALPAESSPVENWDDLMQRLTAGMAVLLLDGSAKGLAFSVQSLKFRSVEEPSGEGDLRGSREGFSDLLRVNLSLLAAGVAGPVGLVCAALVVLLALAQVSALGVPYCAPVRFPQTALSPDGVTRRTYRTLSAHPFSIWQKRR